METFDPNQVPAAPTPAPVTEPPSEPTPKPEPPVEPSDPHVVPLENEDDAKFLHPDDPRRKEVERKRGKKF